MRISVPVCLVGCLMAALLLSGCGKKEKTRVATQVAARVNATEITVSQINAVLNRAPNVQPDAATAARHEILENLISQHLAIQAAVEQRLDRTPDVMQAIESARREVLANAYFRQFVSKQPRPSPRAVEAYFLENPPLFAQRRIFSLEEILIPSTEALNAAVRSRIMHAKSQQEITTHLQAQGIKFSVNSGVRPAEALPLSLLPQLQTMKAGEIKLLENQNGLQVVRLVASTSAPIDQATATPRIEQYLYNQQAARIVADEIRRLKDKADVTYMGEFMQSAVTSATTKTTAPKTAPLP